MFRFTVSMHAFGLIWSSVGYKIYSRTSNCLGVLVTSTTQYDSIVNAEFYSILTLLFRLDWYAYMHCFAKQNTVLV